MSSSTAWGDGVTLWHWHEPKPSVPRYGATGAPGGAGGSQVKTITIRLPDVEAATLAELQKGKKEHRNLELLFRQKIRDDYHAFPGSSWLR